MTRLVLFELSVTNVLLFEHQQKTKTKKNNNKKLLVN